MRYLGPQKRPKAGPLVARFRRGLFGTVPSAPVTKGAHASNVWWVIRLESSSLLALNNNSAAFAQVVTQPSLQDVIVGIPLGMTDCSGSLRARRRGAGHDEA